MSGLNRFLSRREKRPNAEHDRKPRLISGDLYGLFTVDEKKKIDKEEEKKIKAITKRLTRLGIGTLKQSQIEYALRAKDSVGEADKAFELLVLFEDSLEGIIYEYNSRYKLLGAENRQGVTCYLDALLFAMFARLGTFEAILYKSFDDEPRKRLACLLRLWVNMLRRGRLITVDITGHLQQALVACGWKEAGDGNQQDASEAFTFIAETLELPHLTLKMDIFHTGKEDTADDHKFINERLLEVAIPEEPTNGETITLEECLETYFNNKIEVRRDMERRNTMDSSKGYAMHIETADLGSEPATPATPVTKSPLVWSPMSSSSTATRDRSHSLIRDRVVTEIGEASDATRTSSSTSTARGLRRNSIRKEVMMPAWQFFSLIPWYTSRAPKSDAQVAAHFSAQRPVLGLSLKRYSMLPNGRAIRRDTYIDVPLEIGLPHFIQDDNMEDGGPLFGNFKLVLQSVVCHRGVSVDSGHYIALIRGHAPTARATDGLARASDGLARASDGLARASDGLARASDGLARASDGLARASDGLAPDDTSVPAQAIEEEQWMRFDDLSKERVSYVEIQKALREDSPYLLFYQVQPIEQIHDEAPPAYSEREDKNGDGLVMPAAPDDSAAPVEGFEWSRKNMFDVHAPAETPSRSSLSSERRKSVIFPDGTSNDGLRPDMQRGSQTLLDESGGQSRTLSRRSSRAKQGGSKSRQHSQTGEGRLSATMQRLAERMSRDKLDSTSGTSTTDVVQVSGSTDNELDASPGTAESNRRSKKDRKRGLSRNRTVQHEKLEKQKTPDRECSIM